MRVPGPTVTAWPAFTATEVSVPVQPLNDTPTLVALSAFPLADTVEVSVPWRTVVVCTVAAEAVLPLSNS